MSAAMARTLWFIAVVVGVIVAYNLATWRIDGQQATISGVIQYAHSFSPELSAIVGLAMVGLWVHWFKRLF